MIQERVYPTFLKKVTPGPKLWLALGLILSLILVKNTYYAITVMIISIAAVIEEKQFGLFKVILVAMTVLFVSMYAMHGCIAPNIDKVNDPVMFSIFGIKYYASGFAWATKYYLRVGPMMPSLFVIFLSIDMADLSVLMCKLGIPYNAVFTFIDSFQVITLLNKDMDQIRDAQKSRGLQTEGSVITRLKAFVPIIVPVVASSIVKVQDQAIAMDTKGFNTKCEKTVYREITPYKADFYFTITGIALSIFAIGYKVLTALSVIPPVLTNML